MFNLKWTGKRLINWLLGHWNRILCSEMPPLREKPGRFAQRVDYWGGRLILCGIIFVGLSQLNLGLKMAGLLTVGLALGFYLSFKGKRPKIFLRRLRNHVPTVRQVTSGLEEEPPQKKVRNSWRAALGFGLTLLVLGAIYGGAWGWYFKFLGVINLSLALVLVWGGGRTILLTPTEPKNER